MSKKEIFKIMISSIIGGVFLFSAIAKLIHIDNFELYIYSFNIFNYNLTSFFSRGLVLFEMILGVFIILRVQYKYTWWLTFMTMIGFTLFLSILAISGNQDNCHCFGSIVELTPLKSIGKNLVLIVLLALCYKVPELKFRFKNHIVIALSIVVFAIVFVVFPPDFLYNKFAPSDRQMDEISFQALQNDSTISTLSLNEGKKIVAFYISGCGFCKLGMKKIDLIFAKYTLDKSQFNVIVAGKPGKAVQEFTAKTGIEGYPMVQVSKESIPDFMKTIQGAFPTFLFLENGKIVKSVDFRGLNDNEIVTFFQ